MFSGWLVQSDQRPQGGGAEANPQTNNTSWTPCPDSGHNTFSRAAALHLRVGCLMPSDSTATPLGDPTPPFCETHLVAGQQLAPPVCLGHVVDGQAQVVVAVFEEQRVGLVDQPAAKLPLHLHHLLQGVENRELCYCSGL